MTDSADESDQIGALLGSSVSLGGGRSIRPPQGWKADGFVTSDNPLWILPKSRLRWWPEDSDERLNLHWSLSPTPLDQQTMQFLIAIINRGDGEVSQAELQKLAPQLIRIKLDAIKDARVVSESDAGAMLRIEYKYADDDETGIVLYSPTEMYERGEVQILGFEGPGPLFDQHKAVGERALNTFAIGSPFPKQKAKVTNETQFVSGKLQPLKTYTLKAGETISSVVKQNWPDLDDNGRTAKVREVFAYNRTAGNTIEAWNLKEGVVIFLPPN